MGISIKDLKADCHTIAAHYGFEHQSRILQEECGELIVAASKMNRYGENLTVRENFIEELADVTIMIEQMVFLMEPNYRRKYRRMMSDKVARQEERMINYI